MVKLNTKEENATFAGGCFWCMEPAFRLKQGVLRVVAGYSGGAKDDADYGKVSSGKTNHRESVQVTFNSKKISYSELLNVFWQSIDPTDSGGQFADRGKQYKTAIFYHDAKQKESAEKSKQALEKSGKFTKPIATEILPFKEFYPAEEYHQEYYKKHPVQYKMYKIGSGREGFLNSLWGKGK